MQITDEMRWQFTQQTGYFVCGPYNTDYEWGGYSVGIEPNIPSNLHWKDRKKYGGVNSWIKGRGDTLQEAIDKAILTTQGEAK